jgi:hypothetical protein
MAGLDAPRRRDGGTSTSFGQLEPGRGGGLHAAQPRSTARLSRRWARVDGSGSEGGEGDGGDGEGACGERRSVGVKGGGSARGPRDGGRMSGGWAEVGGWVRGWRQAGATRWLWRGGVSAWASDVRAAALMVAVAWAVALLGRWLGRSGGSGSGGGGRVAAMRCGKWAWLGFWLGFWLVDGETSALSS